MARSRYKVKKSRLSAVPIQALRWPAWMPELLPLADVVMEDGAFERAERIAAAIEAQTDKPFDGSASAVLPLMKLSAEEFTKIRAGAAPFFDGFNEAFLPTLGYPYPDGSQKVIDHETAVRTIVYVARCLSDEGTRLATRMRAVHFWLNNLRNDEKVANADEVRATFRAYMDGDESRGPMIRNWSKMLMLKGAQRPSDLWMATVYSWGMETPCMPTEYELPERPAWPMPSLVPIAEAVLEMLSQSTGLMAPMDLAKADVTIALLERARQLTTRILDQTHNNDGLTAEILLRCLADTGLQFRWLVLKNDPNLYAQFKERSHATQFDQIEALRKEYEETVDIPAFVERGLATAHRQLNEDSGGWPALLDVVYGPWSDKSSGSMLKELPDWQTSAITQAWHRGGDAIHGSWRSLSKYSVERCLNTLHLRHSVATDSETKSAGIVPVLAALRIGAEMIADMTTLYPPPPEIGLVERLDAARESLNEWIRSRITSNGFRWDGDPDEEGQTPSE
jgi:hypothetical protein